MSAPIVYIVMFKLGEQIMVLGFLNKIDYDTYIKDNTNAIFFSGQLDTVKYPYVVKHSKGRQIQYFSSISNVSYFLGICPYYEKLFPFSTL